jgi:hypothetical protein
MKTTKLILLALLFGVFSCGGSRVIVENDQYKDFSLTDYKTFDFFEIDAPNSENPNFKENVSYLEETISKELVARGLTKSSTNPDLKINLGIKIEDKVQTRTTSLATDPFMYSGQRSYTWQAKEVPVNTYREGSLTVHLVDLSSNKAVWVGTIDQVLPNKPKNTPAAIESAVTEIFKELDLNNK